MSVLSWTVYATFLAEELGVTQDNIDTTPLGLPDQLGVHLGLDPNWAYHIISQVGNYADIYERNLEPLELARAQNSLYLDGGLLYPPPLR
jgi:general L-amino acid transport system substrate-binding protein